MCAILQNFYLNLLEILRLQRALTYEKYEAVDKWMHEEIKSEK